jgi:hypothetical protein
MSITRWLIGVLVLLGLAALYFVTVLNWSYSTGERAGWVQKLSKKGWLCKTWEGELALVSLPGSPLEKFYFTVNDDAVADQLNRAMGKRVALHYEQKVGLPTSCFGDTRHFVTSLRVQDEIPLAAGVVIPGQPGASGPASAPIPGPPPAPAPSTP